MQYPKPTSFSDPYRDWEGAGDLFRSIISKQDGDLTTEDYEIIFAKHLPAADYTEGAYYIDKCIAHIADGREIHASRLPEGFLWWITHFKEQLTHDHMYEQIKMAVVSAFWKILEEFELFDLTEQECEFFGRDYRFSVGPYNSCTVGDLLEDLTTYDEWHPERDGIVRDLIASDKIEHIRWYVEIAFYTRHWCRTFVPGDAGLFHNYPCKERLFHRLHSFAVLQKKQCVAVEATAREMKWKYNWLVIM